MSETTDTTHTDTLEPVAKRPSRHQSGATRVVIIAAVAVVTVALLAMGVLAATDRSFAGSGQIARNVSIQGVAVADMTADEALGAVQSQWASALPEEITITFAEGEWASSPEEMGVTLSLDEAVDEALAVGREGGFLSRVKTRLLTLRTTMDLSVHRHVDEDALQQVVEDLATVVDREPVDADIEVKGDKVEVVAGKVGRVLNVDGTCQQFARLLEDPNANTLEAVVETQTPNVTAEDLAHIEVVLGEFSTKFRTYQTDRTHNLALAAAALNETVIKPGEVLSLNDRIGERLAERGYRAAPIFLEGEVTPSTGGGICQIATTTYNAALLANLDIVERHHHSRPVDYAPTGQDATVYWGQYDLKVTNNLTHPILLLTSMGDSTVTMRFLGSEEDDYDVEITRTGLSRVGHGSKEIPDPELEEGKREVEKKGRSGWRVNVFREVTRAGEEIREHKLHSDYYGPQTEVIRVGTKKPEDAETPDATDAPETPETGDEAGEPGAPDGMPAGDGDADTTPAGDDAEGGDSE